MERHNSFRDLKVEAYDYVLPEELIAQQPVEPRDSSRLLVLNSRTGFIEHRIFRDIVEYLVPGDVLVVNNSRVLPARLFGVREGTGGKAEFLLLRQLKPDIWEVLVKPGRRLRPGTSVSFGEGRLRADIIDITPAGGRIVEFSYTGVFDEIIDELGQMPLPPYIKQQLDDPERYQTVYSRVKGSAAAPTAGLHFTKQLLETIQAKGVYIADITLHVGLGTFRPVKVENIEDHRMHSEYFTVSPETADLINQARDSGRRVIAVGTTSTRALESLSVIDGKIQPGSGWTDIFIYPGYRFKVIDALITNFHLPKSTLLMLVSALAGRERILAAYREAVRQRYRFYSFGDAMFIY